MAYRVSLRPSAARELGRVRGSAQLALHGAILALGQEPRPRGAIKLSNSLRAWRVRVRIDGVPWRIVYQVDDEQRWARLLRVARRDAATHRAREIDNDLWAAELNAEANSDDLDTAQ
jgi:mRNA interferase RelE/StbE